MKLGYAPTKQDSRAQTNFNPNRTCASLLCHDKNDAEFCFAGEDSRHIGGSSPTRNISHAPRGANTKYKWRID